MSTIARRFREIGLDCPLVEFALQICQAAASRNDSKIALHMHTTCSSCGFHNPQGMRFCGNCGAQLHVSGIQQDSSIPESTDAGSTRARLPKTGPLPAEQLGVMMGAGLKERLEQSGIDASGQRRNVTVLFADLSGYTTLSNQIDSEDLYELVQQFVQLMLNNVYKYEGYVDKLTGDGLMALFGAPISHENNGERGVRAALDMQADVKRMSLEVKERFQASLRLRIGIHSGPVVIGGIGSNLMMDYTAIGDTVNLAHRIEEAAHPGTILVSENIFRSTRALFVFEQITALSLKGIGQPIQAYNVLGLKQQASPVRGLEGMRAPMVGRDSELHLLQESLSSLVDRKEGQFVFILGEAGIGKSRLTAEFHKGLSDYNLHVLEGQSLAYRRSISYWIFQDVLYSYLGLSPNTAQEKVRERLVRKSYQALGNQAAEAIPYLEYLLSISDTASIERLRYLEAGQLRQQIFVTVRDLLIAEANLRPLVLVLDDLHWADEASLELLQFLVEAVRQSPIFVLGISRSSEEDLLKHLLDTARLQLGDRFRTIRLQSLSLDQSEQLLRQLVTIPELPEQLRQEILGRAAGVPFYLEEILRKLIDEGTIRRIGSNWEVATEVGSNSFSLPETLEALVLARFDRLDPFQRQVLQVASVIGKNFNIPVLKAVLRPHQTHQVDEALRALTERDFIQPLDDRRNGEYAFQHVLMSDAIYATLLKKESSRLHGEVGAAIEHLYADRLDGQVELLANHYRWSPRLDRAVHYSILAGQRATRNHLNQQALQHFQAALELIPNISAQPEQVLQSERGMGDVLVFLGDYQGARKHYQAGLLVLDSYPLESFNIEYSALQRRLAKTYERQGDYDQAQHHLSLAQDALQESPVPQPVEQAQILNDLGWIHFRRGNFPEAQPILQAALSKVERSDAYDVIASIYNRLGGVAYNQGDWDLAAGYLRKSIAIRESIRDTVGLATSFNNLGLLEIEMGEFENALENLQRSYELKNRLGQAEGVAMALNNIGWLRIQRGQLAEARHALEQAQGLARQIGYSSLYWEILKNWGLLHMAEGQWIEAERAFRETAPGFQELGANDQLIDVYRLAGESALGKGDLTGAQNWFAMLQDLLQAFGNQAEELSTMQQGELYRFQGMLAIRARDWERASHYLRESERIFQKLHSRLNQGRTAYQQGALAEAQGDQRTALLRFREAALLFKSVGARLEETQAEKARKRQFG